MIVGQVHNKVNPLDSTSLDRFDFPDHGLVYYADWEMRYEFIQI
jgi:hypothetical protein